MILRLLREEPLQSQAALGKACGLTSAIINKYLDTLNSEGLIRIEPINKRDMRYQLTDKGMVATGELLDAYSAEVARTYAFTRSILTDKLVAILRRKPLRVGIFGAGATGEILLMALTDFPQAQLVVIVDSDPSKIGKPLLSYMVAEPSRLSAVLPDLVIVASWGSKRQILETIETLSLPETIKVATL